MDTLIGTFLGGYKLIRVIGSGGMGTVYLAEDETIGQQVAIKVVRTDDADYPDGSSMTRAADRFRQEARAVVSLDHLHILPLSRYGEEETIGGKRAYMVMQYRSEGSLWDWIRRRAGLASSESQAIAPRIPPTLPMTWPMRVEEAGEYLRQAASALNHAHERGIIHRDVKPANFLMRFDPSTTQPGTMHVFLLLSDFGLAKFSTSMSATSSIFGTPIYMAPEQFDGTALPESDQYALAVMIYYFLAGRPPFEGDPLQLMRRHLSMEPAPIRTRVPTLSDGVEHVLARALAKKPQQRYPSMLAFAEAFTQGMYEGVRNISPSIALPQTFTQPDTRNRFSTYLPAQQSRPQSEQNKSLSPTPGAATPSSANLSKPPQGRGMSPATPEQPLVLPSVPSDANAALPPTVYPISPLQPTDHLTPVQHQAWQNFAGAETMLPQLSQALPSSLEQSPYQLSTASSPIPAVPPTPFIPPIQSEPPTGHKIHRRRALTWILGGATAAALGIGTGLYFYIHQSQQPATGIQYILKGHTAAVVGVSWSSDGTQLASASDDHTARLWAISNQQNTLIYKGHNAPVSTIAWDPTSSQLASGGRDDSVQLWKPDGSRQHAFTRLGAPVSALVWANNLGSVLAGTQGTGIHDLLLSGRELKNPIARLVVHSLALSPDGLYLAIGDHTGQILVYRTSNAQRMAFYTLHRGPVLALAWSHNGALLASGGVDHQVHLATPLTGRVQASLTHKEAVTGLAWEPANGPRLATVSTDGNLRIWTPGNQTIGTYAAHSSLTSVAWDTNGVATGATNATILIFAV